MRVMLLPPALCLHRHYYAASEGWWGACACSYRPSLKLGQANSYASQVVSTGVLTPHAPRGMHLPRAGTCTTWQPSPPMWPHAPRGVHPPCGPVPMRPAVPLVPPPCAPRAGGWMPACQRTTRCGPRVYMASGAARPAAVMATVATPAAATPAPASATALLTFADFFLCALALSSSSVPRRM